MPWAVAHNGQLQWAASTMYNVKGSSSHGGNNNSKPFPVFGEVAVGTTAGTFHMESKLLIAAVN